LYQSPYIRFKSSRQQREWFSGSGGVTGGAGVHPALYVVALAAAHWHFRSTGRPAVATHILRHRQEQLEIYPGNPGLRSPHEFGRALDFRTRDLEPGLAGLWEEWVNSAFSYRGREGVRTALLHAVGGRGEHLHVQVGPAESLPRLPDNYVLEV